MVSNGEILVNWEAPQHVHLICGKTDLRKGIDGLALVVQEVHGLDLANDSLFLFCGTRADRFKALYWDGEGFILLYKRYENGSLRWPRYRDDAVDLDHDQLKHLLEGMNPLPIKRVRPALIGPIY